MNLHRLIFTQNACYKSGKLMVPKGIMVHTTGANNPWLKRYVGPDDGLLGKNLYNNYWNQDRPEGKLVCPHAFIGKLQDGTIATYQTLPWNMVGWHSGSGIKGSANNEGYIGFEICEDGLTDPEYLNKVYKEAVELCAYLCKLFGLNEKNIIGHYEGYLKGIASNHGDPKDWFIRYGKSMDTFRSDVRELINSNPVDKPSEGTILLKSKVAIKSSAVVYYPGGSTIPGWVKKDYYHIVTQIIVNRKPVIKGGKTCVLLGKKVKKTGDKVEPGINTWVAVDNLEIVK